MWKMYIVINHEKFQKRKYEKVRSRLTMTTKLNLYIHRIQIGLHFLIENALYVKKKTYKGLRNDRLKNAICLKFTTDEF